MATSLSTGAALPAASFNIQRGRDSWLGIKPLKNEFSLSFKENCCMEAHNIYSSCGMVPGKRTRWPSFWQQIIYPSWHQHLIDFLVRYTYCLLLKGSSFLFQCGSTSQVFVSDCSALVFVKGLSSCLIPLAVTVLRVIHLRDCRSKRKCHSEWYRCLGSSNSSAGAWSGSFKAFVWHLCHLSEAADLGKLLL